MALTRKPTSPAAARLESLDRRQQITSDSTTGPPPANEDLLERDPTSKRWELQGRDEGGDEERSHEPVGREEVVVGPDPEEEFGDGTQLLADARAAFLLINHARRQMISRLLGVTGDDANIVTLIGIMIVAQAARDKAQRLVAPGGPPTLADGALGAAVFRELLADAAGAAARETPLASSLLLLAVASSLARPAILKSATEAIRSASHRVSAGFHHRYGYLVDPLHLRRRRAQRHR